MQVKFENVAKRRKNIEIPVDKDGRKEYNKQVFAEEGIMEHIRDAFDYILH